MSTFNSIMLNDFNCAAKVLCLIFIFYVVALLVLLLV